MRALAQANKVAILGMFWAIDQLFDGLVTKAATIIAGLEVIAAHLHCRLPRAAIQARRERYRRAKKS
jgi:hypothetical protein